MRILKLAAAALIAISAATLSLEAHADKQSDAALQTAVAGTWRTPANIERDAWRKPVEALTFWGLKPGMTVLELSPGGGWWTEILAPYARATKGRYIATAADLNNPELSQGARDARTEFEKRFADPALYGKVELINFGTKSKGLGPDNSVDLVLNGRNIHNWMGGGILDRVMAESFAVLKPGGILAIEEHRNAPGTEQDPKASTGYVTEAFVIAAAERAGFKLDARSDLYANPKDDRDHPFGVWTLPPVKRTAPQGQPADPTFDRAPYDAVGESDRMALRFVKPR
ncbi:MAG: methyltransferase domain-containing protein [Alphaproteobacteria bacterium]|jgi:predicted methyltransferase|nr:methyltransferase domain-containing protein [Alphaproteobacteria bacterium]